MSAIRQRLTYANVVATLALFIALGGGAVWAAHKIGSNQIKNGAVKTKKLANDAATGAKVNEASLGPVPQANNSDRVGGATIRPLSIAAPMQVNSSVLPLLSGSGMSAGFACEQGLPQLVYLGTPSAQAVMTASVITNDPTHAATGPLVHTASSGVDPLPAANNATAEVELRLRQASGAITIARFSFLSRTNGFSSSNDCFLQGEIESY